jgi:hypothetical protein
MAQDQGFYQEVVEWVNGLRRHIAGDALPPNSVYEAVDSQYHDVGDGQTKLGTRPGMRFLAHINSAIGPIVYGNYKHMHSYFHALSELAYTHYLFMVNERGEIIYKDSSDVNLQTSIPSIGLPAGDPNILFLPGGLSHIDSTNMNNRAFFVTGEGHKRSMKGIEVMPFGLPTAVGSTELEATGTSLLEAGTYDVGITLYNEDIGAESNLSEITTVVTSGVNRIKVNLNSSAGDLSTATHWRVYMRDQATQRTLYRVIKLEDLAGAVVTNEGILPKATTTVYISLTAVEIADHIIPAPTTTENTAPPSQMIHVATFGRRMIGASKREIFWSKIDLPDAFPPQNAEVVDTGEGDTIVGLYPYSDELLLIFTDTATFGLFGNDPQSWTLRPIDLTVGCANHKSIVEFESQVAWWSPAHGPVVFTGQGIDKIGYKGFAQDYLTNPVFTANKHLIHGGWDPANSIILWALPDPDDIIFYDTDLSSELIRNLLLPFNYKVGQWAATGWFPCAVASMATGLNSRNEQRLFVTSNDKNLMYFDKDMRTDVTTTGTQDGTFVAASASISGFTDPLATFEVGSVVGGPLWSSICTVFTTDGAFVGRRIIWFNTGGDTVTFLKDLPVTSGQTYQYYIGSPTFSMTTGWWDLLQPFLRKRWDRLYAHVRCEDPSQTIYIDVQLNNDRTGVSDTLEFNVTGESASITGVTDQDFTVYTQEPYIKKRFGIWKNGHMLRVTVRQNAPLTTIVDKLAISGRILHDRYYR